jgi:hypothetical protein
LASDADFVYDDIATAGIDDQERAFSKGCAIVPQVLFEDL